MAVASRHLCRSLHQVSRLVPAKRKCMQSWRVTNQSTVIRPMSMSSSWRADEELPKPSIPSVEPIMAKSTATASPAENTNQQNNTRDNTSGEEDEVLDLDYNVEDMMTPSNPITASDLDPEARADYEALSKPEQERYLALENHYAAMSETEGEDEEVSRSASFLGREISRDFPVPQRKLAMHEQGWWNEDEDDEFGQTEDNDDDFDESYITTVAESQLEVHREVREYMRMAAWDMPLLRKFAKPYEQPSLNQPLQFRYTTYMGESHPAGRKVVVQFCTKDLPGLTEQQREKLIKLVGVRYNPDKDLVKMSCEKFEEAAQNKRYLGDLVGKLVAEAKDGKDTFADVPFDFRHYKGKKRPDYPEEWKLKPQRVRQLVETREEVRLLSDGKGVVDGKRLVEEYVTIPRERPSLRTPTY